MVEIMSKENLPPIAAAQLDLSLIDDDLLSTLFGEGIDKMFQYISGSSKACRRYANALFKALSFWFSVGMGYPTPAMTAFRIQLANRTTKRQLALWMFYSTILPSLWEYFAYTIKIRNSEGEVHDDKMETSCTDSSLASSNSTHDNAASQLMLMNMKRRRYLILWACVTSVSKILPIVQLVHFLQFISSTTKLTSAKPHSSREAAIIPPTLAMRLAGINYTTSSPNISYYYNMTYSHQRMTWNHVKHFILRVGGEEGIRRIMSVLLPPHPSSTVSSDSRRASLGWQRRLMRVWYQTRHILRLWLRPSSLTGFNDVKEICKKASPTIGSLPTYCPFCLTKEIRNPYEALPCHHVHCYMCLRTAALGCVTKAQQQHLDTISTCCLQCGKQIISSRRL